MKKLYSLKYGLFLLAVLQLILLPSLSYAKGCAMMLAKQDHMVQQTTQNMAEMDHDCHEDEEKIMAAEFPAELLCDCCQDDLRPTSTSLLSMDQAELTGLALPVLALDETQFRSINHQAVRFRKKSSDPPPFSSGRHIRIIQSSFLI